MHTKNPITRTEKDFHKRVGQLGRELDQPNNDSCFFVYDVFEKKNTMGELVWHYRYILLQDAVPRVAPVWTFTDCVVWLKDLQDNNEWDKYPDHDKRKAE